MFESPYTAVSSTPHWTVCCCSHTELQSIVSRIQLIIHTFQQQQCKTHPKTVLEHATGLYRIQNNGYLELELTTLLIPTRVMSITNYFNDNYHIINQILIITYVVIVRRVMSRYLHIVNMKVAGLFNYTVISCL